MVEELESQFSASRQDCGDVSMAYAIYAFASENYAGEHSNMYKALCMTGIESLYEIDENWLDENDLLASIMYNHLKDTFLR